MSFNNKVVIITGASSGIGAAAAVSFVSEGAQVVIVGRNELNLEEVAKKCSEIGKLPLVIKANVSIDSEAVGVIEKTIDKFGKLDVLVNNAGVLRYSLVTDVNFMETYDSIININLRTVFLLTHLAIPYLMKSNGNIVNVSSVMDGMRLIGYTAYCTSKAALSQFTRASANELAAKGVRVNAISPGPCHTHIFDTTEDLSWDKLKSLTALDKIMEPDEVAQLITYLASEKASSVTGSNFVIDCGAAIKQ